MKGILKSVYLAGMTGVTILVFAGCSQSFGGVSDTGVPRDNYNAVTETGTTYQNLLSLTVNAVTKSVEKVMEYDENVMAQFNERSSVGRVFDLDDIYALTDIEKTKNAGARSAGGMMPERLETN
jgi:hypothetical protein